MSAQGSDYSPKDSPRRALSGALRRRALRLGLINGALWSIGNGLSTGSLMYYLAQELGAQGTAVSLLIAAPSLIGLLRLVTPRLIAPLGGTKAACLKMLLAAYVLLSLGMPSITLLGVESRRAMLAALITLICVHQLLEYIGSVALWSWLGALVPPRIRGRYFGRRNLWQMAVLIPTLLASGAFTDHWKQTHLSTEPDRVLLGYIIPTTLGGCLLLASLLPLVFMPDVAIVRRRAGGGIVAALADRRYGRLLMYRGWF